MDELLYGLLTNLPTLVLLGVIAATLFALGKGADILVDEAVSLSVHWGVPKMVIGATIVSLGTTLPEATVSVIAALNGNPDLALGNAIGSIILNATLILGAAAMLGKIPVDEVIAKRQGKIMFYVGALLTLACLPIFSKTGTGNVSQLVGFVFVVLLGIYLYLSMKWSRDSQSKGDSFEEEKSSVLTQVLKLALGVGLVILSSKVLIPTVEITALRVGIPQSIIAATLVAFGTSLPELVTSLTAVKKGHGELAVGNVVGANVLNVLFVIGAAAAVTPTGLVVPPTFLKLHIPVMMLTLLSFRYFSTTKEKQITKMEGFYLLGIFTVYIVLNYLWA